MFQMMALIAPTILSAFNIPTLSSPPFPRPRWPPPLSVSLWQCSSPTPAIIPTTLIHTSEACGLGKSGKGTCFVFVCIIFTTSIPASSTLHPCTIYTAPVLSYPGSALPRAHCGNFPTPGASLHPWTEKVFPREHNQRGSRREKEKGAREEEREQLQILNIQNSLYKGNGATGVKI